MKTYNFTDANDDNVASFYVTNDGDIVDTIEDANITGYAIAEIIVHGFYPGSLDAMRDRAARLYRGALEKGEGE